MLSSSSVLIVPVLALALAQSSPPGRGLTPGERAFLAPLFGEAVDYDAIRIVRGRAFPMQGSRTLITIRQTVFAPAPVYCDDFAQVELERQAILVHEVAHVWQHTNGINVMAGAVRAFFASGGRYTRAYHYQLAPGRDLVEYGIEQQASILEHYFLTRGHAALRYGEVLQRFLADPRYPRDRRDRRHRLTARRRR